MKAAMSTKHTLKLSSMLDILFHFVAFSYMQKLCRIEHGLQIYFFFWKDLCPITWPTTWLDKTKFWSDITKKGLTLRRVKLRTYYANVKENFITQVNVV